LRLNNGTARLAASIMVLAACGATGPDEDPNAVDRVEVQPAQHTLHLGVDNQVQLNATASNRAGATLAGKAVSWRSSAAGVATVSSSGVVTAVGLGSAMVSAAVDGVEGSASIVVEPPPVATVTLSLGAAVMVTGGSSASTTVVRDAAGNELTDRPVTFTSSSEAVASVSPQGLVTAVSTGTSTITASSEGRTSAAPVCVLGTAPNLILDNVLLAQVSQREAGDIPLVSGGLPAEVRVHATSDVALPAGCQPPRLRLIAYDGAAEVLREEKNVVGQLPLVVNVSLPAARFILPASVITPTLRLHVEIDPHDVVPESNAADNAWPATGPAAQVQVMDVPPLEVRFVPVFLANGGSLGQVTENDMTEYLYATRQLYPVSMIDHDIGETMATNAAYGSGEIGPFAQMLGELDLKRVAEGTRRYYMGAVRPPPGVTFTQFGGIGYVPGNQASFGPNTRTAIVVGVGWFARQRQTTELVAHELGHNHGRRHAPCGGAANPDAAYPHAGATIGVPGTDMYTWSVDGGAPPQLGAFSTFDIMSYCTPAWISDYNYQALLAARIAAGPVAATATETGRGATCECLIVWGSIHADSITINPAFVTRTRAQLPSKSGSYVVEGVRENGGTAFSYAFEPAEIDHAPGVRHFTFAIPLAEADRASLELLRVRGRGRTGTLDRGRAALLNAEVMRLSAGRTTLQRSAGATFTELSWPAQSFRSALLRNPRTGAVIGVSTGGSLALSADIDEVEAVLSDGVRSQTVRVRRVQR